MSKTFSTCDDVRRDVLVMMYVERVMIPVSLRKQILKDFYIGHSGMSRMKSLMRSFVQWPGIDRDIEVLVKNCVEVER